MKKIIIFFILLWHNTFLYSITYQVSTSSPNNGFFSIFFSVIGALNVYDKQLNNCTGITINFGNQGIYYDQAYGPNWWHYYFEPIIINDKQPKQPFSNVDLHSFALSALYEMTCQQGHELIKKYIRIKPHIQKKIDDYIRQFFKNQTIIGVHYRGTDKVIEAPPLPYDVVIRLIRNEIEKDPNIKIFVATDEGKFLQSMIKNFPNKIVYIDTFRSFDGKPVHHSSYSNYRKGEDALIDCILLSQCSKLYRTSSNLSAASTRFNPSLEVILLNKNIHELNLP